MAISRAQMRRQLYMGGGIASLEPRQQYGLGSIVKSVTKAVKGVGDAVGDIVSSDAGKLALLAAGAYYAPTMFGAKAGFSSYPSIFGAAKNIALSKLPTTALGKGAAILGGSALLTSLFGSPDQAQEAFNRDPSYVKSALAKYYKNINKDASEEEVQEFVNKNVLEFGDVSRSDVVSGYEKNIKSNLEGYDYANGGRVGLAGGGNINTFALYQQYLNELEDARANQQNNILYNPTISYQTGDGDQNNGLDPDNVNNRSLRETVDTIKGRYNELGLLGMFGSGFTGGVDNVNSMSISNAISNYGLFNDFTGTGLGLNTGPGGVNMDAVYGDMGGFSDGTSSASDGGEAGAAAASAAGSNDGPGGGTFAEGGIPSIPTGELRENAQGIQELDYRQDGGFVPVGIKEKADDVPAMLSKNEFVMTADAVRGMGNGSIENGAQKMYNLMKSLENRMA